MLPAAPSYSSDYGTRRALAPILGAIVLGAACSRAPAPADLADSAPAAVALAVDAAPGSALPRLSVDAHGRVYLSWTEPAADCHALRFAVLEGAQWSVPRTVAQGCDWFVNWADFPSLVALNDGTLAAHWLRRSGADSYAYDVNLSFSHDGGASWSAPVTPHSDGTLTEHGFVSLLPWGENTLFALWLDGRAMAAYGEDEAERHAAMSLRSALFDGSGTLLREDEVDPRTCSCCQTSAAAVAEGVLIAYRDRSDAEIRDIAVQRFTATGWSGPRTLHEDGWRIEGCPVNGPSVAARDRSAAIAWFTGANDEPRLWLKRSSDGGATFGESVRIDAGRPLGRVHVALSADGTAQVLWLEQTNSGAQLRLRPVSAAGEAGLARTLSGAAGTRHSGFPQLAVAGEQLIVAWTDAAGDGPTQLRSVRLPVRPAG